MNQKDNTVNNELEIEEQDMDLDNYQDAIKSMESFLNSLGYCAFNKQKIKLGKNLISNITRIISILPNDDPEIYFLADFLKNLSIAFIVLFSLEVPLNQLSESICRVLQREVFPFLYEESTTFTDKRLYIVNLLDILTKLPTNCMECLSNGSFVQYVSNVSDYFSSDNYIQSKVYSLLTLITGPNTLPATIMRLNAKLLIQRMVQLFSASIVNEFSGSNLLYLGLCAIQQLVKVEKTDIELSERLQIPKEVADCYHVTVSILLESKSFVWLVRILSHRDIKIRIKAWQVLCTLISEELMENQGNILEIAIETTLRQYEFYGVKLRAIEFLSKSLSHLNESISTIKEVIKKTKFLKRCKGFLMRKDAPILLVGALARLIKELVLIDYITVVSIFEEIDFWTTLTNYLEICSTQKMNITYTETTIHICLISILELIIETLFRAPLLARKLLVSAQLLNKLYSLFTRTLVNYSSIKSPILSTYVNRMFTCWMIFMEHEAKLTSSILHGEILKSNKVVQAYNLCSEINSYIAVSKLFAVVAREWNKEEFGVIEGVAGEVMKKMGEGYALIMNNEESLTQCQYDIISCMSLFICRSKNAKIEVFTANQYKQIIHHMLKFNSSRNNISMHKVVDTIIQSPLKFLKCLFMNSGELIAIHKSKSLHHL